VRDAFPQSVRTLMVESAPPERARPVLSLLNRAEADDPGKVTLAEQRPARSEVASLLAVEVGAALVLRQRVIVREDTEKTPVVFVSLWLRPELALATGMDRLEPLDESLRELAASAGQPLRNVTECLRSRLPTSAESAGLAISRRTPVLGLLAAVMDASDRPVLALDLAFPGDLHQVIDSYAV
jgi:GntR family transcriptional regulator